MLENVCKECYYIMTKHSFISYAIYEDCRDLMVYIICLLIGVSAAFLGGLVGLGGGIILIPALLFLHQYATSFAWATPQVIVGISLITMVFTALSATITYSKQERIDYKAGILLLIGCVPGGILGSWLSQFLNTDQFSLYFGLLMMIVSLLSFIGRRQPTQQLLQKNGGKIRTIHIDGETYHYQITLLPAFIISFIVGVLSGLFGIGGGSITVPALMLVFGIPIQIAIATSMFMILFISMISTVTHIVLGHIVWHYAILFMIGAWLGGSIGARTNQSLKGKTLEWILRAVLIIVGLRLIMDGL